MRNQYVVGLAVLLAMVVPIGGCGTSTSPPPEEALPQQPLSQQPLPQQPKALPDFSIVGVEVEPGTLVPPGTAIRFSVHVKNIGNGALPQNAGLFVSGPGTGGFISGGLMPGETKVAKRDWKAAQSSTTWSGIVFTVDPDNVIEESNENNNDSDPITIGTLP